MRRLVVLAGVLAMLAPAFVFAGQTASKAPAEKPKTMTAAGDVTAVAPASLTIKAKSGDSTTFTIDKDTTVIAKGATHKSLALKAEGKQQTLTEFVKTGDSVDVTYREAGANKLARTIRVLPVATKK